MQPVEVVGVRLEMPSNQPVVLLRVPDTKTYLPIWIGSVEGSAIAFVKDGVVPPRPLTHDLMASVLHALDKPLREVQITHLSEGTYYATLVFSDGTEVSARPSDAIALALRMDTPVLANDDVLAEAGVEIDNPEAEATETPVADNDDELRRFREFLDEVTPEDFEGSGP